MRYEACQLTVAYEPLREVLLGAESELDARRTYSAVVLLITALELATLLLLIRADILAKTALEGANLGNLAVENRRLSLTAKNDLLRARGVYGDETYGQIRDLITVRNRLFHGHTESQWANFTCSLDRALELYNWVCSFVEDARLSTYTLDLIVPPM